MKTYTIEPSETKDKAPPVAEEDPNEKARRINKPKIAPIDLHPDVFDCVELAQGQRAIDATRQRSWQQIPTGKLSQWAKKHLDPDIHLIVIEATSNCFDAIGKLVDAGFSAIAVESNQVSKVGDAFLDNDEIAAERIGRCYLTGFTKVVWVPDEKTRERRELLHSYLNAVSDCTRANNELKSYLTTFNIRPGKRNLCQPENQNWIREKMGDKLTEVREANLTNLFSKLAQAKATKDLYYTMICREMAQNKQMLNCLRVVGIGLINAFAIVAIVGDIRRFAHAKKLVSYLGLNPGSKKSGRGKEMKFGVGHRGRKDIRALLIQAAQAVLRKSRAETNQLARWGFKLFARKGNRNVAVAAIARKLVHMLYHILSGRIVTHKEQRKPMERKLYIISRTLGKEGRVELDLPSKPGEAVEQMFTLSGWPKDNNN